MSKYVEEEKSSFDTIMDLPEEMFDEDEPEESRTPNPGSSMEVLSHAEDISDDLAEQLIGKNQMKPNCMYKLITTPYHTCVAQYNMSKDKDDPDYRTEFELEEYREGYHTTLDEYSVSSGFWQGEDVPKRINPMAVISIIIVILLFVGLGILGFLFSI